MKVVGKSGDDSLATVFIAESESGNHLEFVESIQPPVPREKKWVLIVSTLYGCPIKCRFCDAGSHYKGKVSAEDLFNQIDFMVKNRFPDGKIPIEKFKIQFARMGEPALNPNVLDVLEELPNRYDAPGLMPTISTIAPKGCDDFLSRVKTIKDKLYGSRFQLQFSIHSTDSKLRDWIIPVQKWSLPQIAEYGKDFYQEGERKITLNFALAQDTPIDPDILLYYFSPEIFFIKITPINPTYQAHSNQMTSYINPNQEEYDTVKRLKQAGYDVLISIGQWEENQIGSNCGQYITHFKKTNAQLENSYTSPVEPMNESNKKETIAIQGGLYD